MHTNPFAWTNTPNTHLRRVAPTAIRDGGNSIEVSGGRQLVDNGKDQQQRRTAALWRQMVLPTNFQSLTTLAEAKPHSIVGLGGHLGEHVNSGSGAVTEATPGEAAALEVVPMVAAARDPCYNLVSNRSLGQEDGARLLASVVLVVGG
ncbi:unnamed protein product [Lactuca virosa]|uniref:Uncharacterized protein n=1 Tax=Lactuca virosa TaxID=75947 RepID=A0AAU9PL48_9ASTR|nr:unnamed protein product [Lactuca virosa]